MSNLRQQPLVNGQVPTTARPRVSIDAAGCAGNLAAWIVVLSVGPILWAINGGYSVIGLGIVARSFNDAGKLFWAMMVSLRFTLPVNVPGLDNTQPLLPWALVVASSLLQIVVFWLKLQRRSIPTWFILLAILLSIYDYTTTLFGFGTVAWIRSAGYVVQIPLAFLVTFGLEATVGFLLRR